MRGYQESTRVHERKNMRMWGYEDTNKHTEYLRLRIRRWEDMRLQANIHEPKTHEEYEDASMQMTAHKSQDMRVEGCEDTSK